MQLGVARIFVCLIERVGIQGERCPSDDTHRMAGERRHAVVVRAPRVDGGEHFFPFRAGIGPRSAEHIPPDAAVRRQGDSQSFRCSVQSGKYAGRRLAGDNAITVAISIARSIGSNNEIRGRLGRHRGDVDRWCAAPDRNGFVDGVHPLRERCGFRINDDRGRAGAIFSCSWYFGAADVIRR